MTNRVIREFDLTGDNTITVPRNAVILHAYFKTGTNAASLVFLFDKNDEDMQRRFICLPAVAEVESDLKFVRAIEHDGRNKFSEPYYVFEKIVNPVQSVKPLESFTFPLHTTPATSLSEHDKAYQLGRTALEAATYAKTVLYRQLERLTGCLNSRGELDIGGYDENTSIGREYRSAIEMLGNFDPARIKQDEANTRVTPNLDPLRTQA